MVLSWVLKSGFGVNNCLGGGGLRQGVGVVIFILFFIVYHHCVDVQLIHTTSYSSLLA